MHPERGIVRTYRRLDGISTIPEYPNTIHPISVGVESGGGGGVSLKKGDLYAKERNYKGPHYHPPTSRWNFWRTLMMAWNGCLDITRDP